jgi:DNA-binding CsgD family transcriptional regulator
MVLTREERERLVLDLYNQGSTYKEIAKEVRISPRDIKAIMDKAIEQKEKEAQKQKILNNNGTEYESNKNRQEISEAAKAYQLFSENKSPTEVAIALNIRESKVTTYHREYWKLNNLHALNSLYKEITIDGVAHLLRLYRYTKNAHMGIREVVNLLKLANNELPSLENRYHRLKREVDGLEYQKVNSKRTLHRLEDQIINLNQIRDCYRTSCQEEIRKLGYWRKEMTRLKKLVIEFKNNNEEYLKIKMTVESKISSILLDGKGLLRLAFFSLMDSMRKDPDKYGSLINHNNRLSSSYSHYSVPFPSERLSHYPSYDYFFEAYKSALLEDAEKLYHQLLREQANSIISNYPCNNRSLSLRRNAMARQTFRYRREITLHS